MGIKTSALRMEQYEELLRELHKLISIGLGDSQRSNELRDRMGTLWRDMSPEEQIDMEFLYDRLFRMKEIV